LLDTQDGGPASWASLKAENARVEKENARAENEIARLQAEVQLWKSAAEARSSSVFSLQQLRFGLPCVSGGGGRAFEA
jgi:hypothetical protein